MWRWKRQAAAGPDFSQLHDSIALKILQAVKEEPTSLLLDGGVVLHSRGAVERVCSRWRALALQMPAAITVDLCELHEADLDVEEVLCEVQELLPLLAIRNVHRLSIGGCTTALAPRVPSLLAGTLFPGLRRLTLRGGSLLFFSSHLAFCRQLEHLELQFIDFEILYDQLPLLSSHLCAVPRPLRMLTLRAPHLPASLLEIVRIEVEPAAVAIATYSGPQACMWLPQLRKLSLRLNSSVDETRLEQGLPALLQLESLALIDLRRANYLSAFMLPSLPSLPRLRKLSTQGVMPLSAWRCPHLTSLACRGMVNAMVPVGMQPGCPPLRQLLLEGSFGGPASSFPAQFCALSSLTSLALLWDMSAKHSVAVAQVGHFGQRLGFGTASALPAAFSQLSSLRQLVITNASLDRASMDALHRLSQLTALRLPDCQLQCLPCGLYLAGLQSLDICGNPALNQPIPFQLTAAEGLRALRVTLPKHWTAEEGWEDMQAKLSSLRRLEFVSIGVNFNGKVTRQQLMELVARGGFTFRLEPVIYDGCLIDKRHPEFNGMASFSDSDDE